MKRTRSRKLKSASRPLRLESLETRQLLTTVQGAGTDIADFGLLSAHSSATIYSDQQRASADVDLHLLDVARGWEFVDAQDYTNDGVPDLLGQTPDGNFWLRVNDGQQMFELPWGSDIIGETELLGIADFNGDELPDLLSYDRVNGNMWVSTNSLDLGFTHEIWSNFTPRAEWTDFRIGDFNGDGRNDVLGTETGGHVWLARNTGVGDFTNRFWGDFPDFDWLDVLNGDFNGDGLQDLAARGTDDTWWLWEGSRSGFDVARYWGHWKMADGWSDVRVGDFNSDGRDDVIARTSDGRLRVGSSSDEQLHTWVWGKGWHDDAGWSNIEIVDVNGDGRPDQVGRAADNTWWYATNEGTHFRNHYWFQETNSEQAVVVKDFYRPESIDLSHLFTAGSDDGIRVSLDEDNLLVLTGSGQPTFGFQILSPSGSLVPIPPTGSAFPMTFMLSNTPQDVTLASLGSPYRLIGSVTLDVGWNPESGANDLVVNFGMRDPIMAVLDGVLGPATEHSQAERNDIMYYSHIDVALVKA